MNGLPTFSWAATPFAKILAGPLGAPRGVAAPTLGFDDNIPFGPCKLAGILDAIGCCNGIDPA